MYNAANSQQSNTNIVQTKKFGNFLKYLCNNLHLTISFLELPCGFHTPFEMWIVIVKGRDYFEDAAINGQIEMHFERMVLGCVDCICIALSGDQRWDVLNTLMKPSMP